MDHLSHLRVLLPPANANDVCEGNVFTGICLSTGVSLSRGISVQWGLCPGGGVCLRQGDPQYGKEQTVRILLECILVGGSFESSEGLFTTSISVATTV